MQSRLDETMTLGNEIRINTISGDLFQTNIDYRKREEEERKEKAQKKAERGELDDREIGRHKWWEQNILFKNG